MEISLLAVESWPQAQFQKPRLRYSGDPLRPDPQRNTALQNYEPSLQQLCSVGKNLLCHSVLTWLNPLWPQNVCLDEEATFFSAREVGNAMQGAIYLPLWLIQLHSNPVPSSKRYRAIIPDCPTQPPPVGNRHITSLSGVGRGLFEHGVTFRIKNPLRGGGGDFVLESYIWRISTGGNFTLYFEVMIIKTCKLHIRQKWKQLLHILKMTTFCSPSNGWELLGKDQT